MFVQWLTLYGAVLIFSLLISLGSCGIAGKLGLKWGLMDIPQGRKTHARPVALTGGYGIFFSFAIIVLMGTLSAGLLGSWLDEDNPLARYIENIRGVQPQIFAILTGALIIFCLGAWDDRKPMGPRVKLVIQCLAILPLLITGITLKGFLPDPAGWILTILWILLLTNSFNLLDNMDGQSALVATVICMVLSIAAVRGGELWLPAMFLCLAGTLLGFLHYNFHPARLFMGDAGSLTTGYLVAIFSVLVTYYQQGTPSGFPVLMPLAIMGVPLFDILSVMFIRWRNRQPLMTGDRNHFSHRLLAMGFSVRSASLTIAMLTASCGLLALALRTLALPDAIMHVFALVLLFGVIVSMELVGRK
jgi:UDP-GlcNAc:undecaprenyl-phosphate GlcNAc-1-phosphate transferase